MIDDLIKKLIPHIEGSKKWKLLAKKKYASDLGSGKLQESHEDQLGCGKENPIDHLRDSTQMFWELVKLHLLAAQNIF